MKSTSNDENLVPKSKSVHKLKLNNIFKNNFQTKGYINNDKLESRTPLKSKMNQFNIHRQIEQSNNNMSKFPKIKSLSSSSIVNFCTFNEKENNYYNINNNKNLDNDEEKFYNKNALPDDSEDFMHIDMKEISFEEIKNEKFPLSSPKELNINLIEDYDYQNDYFLSSHLNDFENKQKQYDDYFNSQDSEPNSQLEI